MSVLPAIPIRRLSDREETLLWQAVASDRPVPSGEAWTLWPYLEHVVDGIRIAAHGLLDAHLVEVQGDRARLTRRGRQHLFDLAGGSGS